MYPTGKKGAGSSSHSDRVTRANPKPGPQFVIPQNVAFYLCLLSNTLAASLAPIQDCDEVFNYWEPTHYLNHGYGLQTWEYSPEYSIRSWLYIAFHSIIGKASAIISPSKVTEFYFIRLALALTCTVCETSLFSTISRTLNPRVGVLFLMIMLFSPGMFHASAALLPSSFTMYTSMLGLTAFMDWRGGLKTARGIMWFGIGALVGWPFAGALAVPFLLEEIAIAIVSGDIRPTISRFIDGVARCLLVLGSEVAVDSFFYRKLVVVPWNIVAYNVFGGKGRGPNIFGTESWTFYIRNLLLNFNVWFVFALSAAPLLVLQTIYRSHTTSKQTLLRSVTFILPFYIWLAIFTCQPHKEERFMFPAYPFLTLNAAIALHILLSYIGSSNPRELMGRIPPKLRSMVVISFVFVMTNLGLLRTIGMITAYSAPLLTLQSLEKPGIGNPGDSVCFGKEWYRFPSSFFLPNGMRAKFVRSEFRGLLPGEFTEAEANQVPFASTWVIPSGMNDHNQEDPGKYTNISDCVFLVDSYFPGSDESELQPHHVLDSSTWEAVSCYSFLDAGSTSVLGRVLWIPDWSWIPRQLRRKWGQYCLLRRREVDGTT